MNIYDRNSFDIESLDENSKGIQLAKRITLSRIIIALYGIALVFVGLYFGYYKHIEWFDDTFPALFIVSTLCLCMGLVFTCNIVIAKKTKPLSLQEKHDYNMYLYYKIYHLRKGYRNLALLALARIDAMTGDREQCKNAVDMISSNFNNDDLKVINEWLCTDNPPLTKEAFKEPKQPKAWYFLIGGLIIFYGLSYAGLNIDMFYFSNVPGYIALLSGVIASIAFAFAYTLGICAIIIKIRRKMIPTVIITLILFVFTICMFFIIGKDSYEYCYYRHTGEYYGSDSYDLGDEEYYDYSYDEYEDYDEDQYIDISSEPVDEIDIMNYMIILSGYLKEQGIIEDYFTNLLISITAKGNVRGTVYRDEEYEYNLYDNGTKQDENGNECIELVLEAEPLDEDGNSLGQAEARLKGFYLVNLETNEIIDEHKTHW